MEDPADITGLLHASSVYLDHNISKSMADAENFNAAQARPPDADPDPKPRKKTRQERAERVAAEQAIWLRQKFDLPDTEQLIASFTAALVRSILLQGRIYITSTTVCFYAKIFGRVTKESFQFSKLARVKKRKGGFVANAIKVYFSEDGVSPIVIGSLNHRDRAFEIIQERLREINPPAAEAPDADDTASAISVGNSQGADSEERSIEDDYGQHAGSDDVTAPYRVGDTGGVGAGRPPRHGARDVNLRSQTSDSSDISSGRSSDTDGQQPPPADHALRDGPPLVWMTTHDVTDRVHGKAYEKKAERARGLLHAPVKEVFNLLFVSDWLKHYHDSSNNRDVAFTDWYRGKDGFMEREVTFKKPLAYKIGPKETRVKETQRYSFTEVGGVVVELEGQNLDAPYGDYFVCESFFEIIPQGPTSSLLVLSIAVHFHRTTILRGKIESGTLSETKIAFQRLYDLASQRIEAHLSSKPTSGGAQKRQTENIPGATPVSPTKKLRSSQETPVPMENVNGHIAKPADGVVTTSPMTETPPTKTLTTKMPVSAVQVRDSASTRTLRIAAISALIAVCILLVAVLLLLNKMRGEVNALEKIVAALSVGDPGKCIASACAAGGTR